MRSEYSLCVDDVVRESRKNGLTVERVPTTAVDSLAEAASVRRWLLIQGIPSQVVPTKIQQIPNPQGKLYPCVRLYVPRTNFPRFLIYVVTNASHSSQYPRFYVVPRQALRKDTFRRVHKLIRYANAWRFLLRYAKRATPGTPRAPIYEAIPSETRFVISEAKRRGLTVNILIRKHTSKAPFKRRLLIEGHRCEVSKASRLSANPMKIHHSYVGLRRAKSTWPDFLIIVLWQHDKRHRPNFFVLPRKKITKDTTTTQTAWLPDYEAGWDLLTENR